MDYYTILQPLNSELSREPTPTRIPTSALTFSSNVEGVPADKIMAGILTGLTIQTASSGQRVVISSSNDILFYDPDGNLTGKIVGGKVGTDRGFIFSNPYYTPNPTMRMMGVNVELISVQNFNLDDKFVMDNSGGTYDKMLRPVNDNEWQLGRTGARMKDVRSVLINGADYGFENKWYLTESYKVGIKEEGIALVDDKNNLKLFIGETGIYVKGGNVKNLDLLPYVKTTLEQRRYMDKYPELRNKGEGAKVEPIPNPDDAKIGG